MKTIAQAFKIPANPGQGKIIAFAREVQCQTCDDMGLVKKNVPVDHPDFGKAFPCPNPNCPVIIAGQQQRLERMFAESGIKPGYDECTFASWDALPPRLHQSKITARLAMQMYAERGGEPFALSELHTFARGELAAKLKRLYATETVPKSGVILAGTNGTGKTGLLASAAHALLEVGKPVLFINMLEMLGEIFDGYGPKADARQKLEFVKGVEHLFADELTFETKDSHRRALQEIFRGRHDNSLPVAITTNWTLQDFESWLGAQTASGLLGMCHWIAIGGEPLRHENSPVSDLIF